MSFHTATKQQARLRLALIGPAGSGKTFSALALGTHLVPGGRLALLDSEHGSASLYADRFHFDTQALASCHPQRYIAAIQEAEEAGYDVLIIDSLSHAWMGRDGILELVDRETLRSQSKNAFTEGWRKASPEHNRLVEAMLASRLHLIVTMRSKMEYIVDKDDKGKTVVRKVGMQPIQRDGLEYEFDVVADLDLDNTLVVAKTRCSALQGALIPKPGQALATTLRQWLSDGATPPQPDTPSQPDVPPVISVPPALPLPPAPVLTTPPVPVSGNGHGKAKAARICTARWQAAAQALAARCPAYTKPDGQPDYRHMTQVAAEQGYTEINDGNLTAVIAALELAVQAPLPA